MFDTPGLTLARASPMRLLRESCPLFDKVGQLNSSLIDGIVNGFDPGSRSELTEQTCSYQGESLKRYLEEVYDCVGLSS